MTAGKIGQLDKSRISQAAFDDIVASARVLSGDPGGPCILVLPDNRFLKIFRPARWLSSSRFVPYARRFERAAHSLATRGIRTVTVESSFKIHGTGRTGIIYRPVPGIDMRQALLGPARRESLLSRLAEYFADLHAKGVFFHSMHLGNIIVDPKGQFGLVDITRVGFVRRRLDRGRRARSFKPIFNHPEDQAHLASFGYERFFKLYMAAARLATRDQDRFLRALMRKIPALHGQCTRQT